MKRMVGLDAVRGVAALMVACGHSFIAVKFSGQDLLWTHPDAAGADARIVSALMYAFDGTVAVTTFFVLSGIVLGLSLDGKALSVREYAAFIVRRALRIYPAHLVVLAAICALLWLGMVGNDFPGSTTWYRWWYASAPTWSDVLATATLQAAALNPVTWTLRVEMIVALVFPLLHVLSRRGAILAAATLGGLLFFPDFTPHAYKFFLGLLIPVYARPVLDWFARLTVPGPLAHFGQVSYSFYLWHFPVLWFGYWALHHSEIQPVLMAHTLAVAIGMCAVSVLIAYGLAVLTYRFVELPGMRLGQSRMRSQAGTPAGAHGGPIRKALGDNPS